MRSSLLQFEDEPRAGYHIPNHQEMYGLISLSPLTQRYLAHLGEFHAKKPHENFSKLYLASPLDALLNHLSEAQHHAFLRRHQFFLPEHLSKMPLLLSRQSILKILRTQYYYKFHLLQENLHLVGNYQQIQVDQKALPLQGSTVAL